MVLQKSHNLVFDVYKTVNFFPKDEQFNIVSQIKTASISNATFIEEGCLKTKIKSTIKK